jgi:hypothetical protein
MLNGVAPLLLFEFKYGLPSPPTEGLPDFLSSIIDWSIGTIPVPIYLDPQLTGIQITSGSKAIDIETDIQPNYANSKKPIINQRGVSSIVSVNMQCNRDNILASVLLAFMDQILAKTVSKEYKVSYFNGVTTVFQGLVHGFSVSENENTDLMSMTLQLQKPSTSNPVEGVTTFSLPRITGALPS